MSDGIKPALTPDEWARVLVMSRDTSPLLLIESCFLDNDGATAMAVGNYVLPDEDPRKFTHQDVENLRNAAEALQGNSDADGVLSIAARIAALLPP